MTFVADKNKTTLRTNKDNTCLHSSGDSGRFYASHRFTQTRQIDRARIKSRKTLFYGRSHQHTAKPPMMQTTSPNDGKVILSSLRLSLVAYGNSISAAQPSPGD